MSSPTIPLLDLKRQYEPLQSELKDAFARVLHSSAFILGKEVAAFETEIAELLEVEHAIAVSNGTDAIWLALKALDIGPGDKVITTPFTFFASVAPILNVGATPLFADIDEATFNIDPKKVEALLKSEEKVKAILPVHLYGLPADMTALKALSEKYQVPIIEDAAQAILASHQGKKVGSIGKLATFSFHPSKNLGAFGDAGLVTTNDVGAAEKIKQLRIHGRVAKYEHRYVGSNCRMDALQAALLRVCLPHLKTWIAQRIANAAFFNERLSSLASLITTPKVPEQSEHTYHLYTLRVDPTKRDPLSSFLSERGIANGIYYPVPCHLQEAIKSAAPPNLPVSEMASKQVLSIPVFPTLTSGERERIVNSIAEWSAK